MAMQLEDCPSCEAAMEDCACGYGFCDTCGEEWNMDEFIGCPNSADSLGLDEEDEDYAEACEGEWVSWKEDALS